MKKELLRIPIALHEHESERLDAVTPKPRTMYEACFIAILFISQRLYLRATRRPPKTQFRLIETELVGRSEGSGSKKRTILLPTGIITVIHAIKLAVDSRGGRLWNSGDTFCPDICLGNSNVNCFRINKNCSARLRLYCLLFQKTKLEPNIKLTRIGKHNKYVSFEEVVVDFAVMSALPQVAQEFHINYKLNLFEKDVLFLLEPYMPNLPVALDHLFENYEI